MELGENRDSGGRETREIWKAGRVVRGRGTYEMQSSGGGQENRDRVYRTRAVVGFPNKDETSFARSACIKRFLRDHTGHGTLLSVLSNLQTRRKYSEEPTERNILENSLVRQRVAAQPWIGMTRNSRTCP